MPELMAQMLKQLFINFTILISFITIGNQFFRDKLDIASSPLHRRLITGAASGMLGCILMAFGFNLHGVYIDLRIVPVIIMGIYLSPESVVTSALLISVVRLLFAGPSLASGVAFLGMLAIGAMCLFVGRMKVGLKLKWVFSVAGACVINFLNFSLMIAGVRQAMEVWSVYFCAIAVTSLVLYFIMDRIGESNRIFDRADKDSKRDFLTGLNNVRQFDVLLNDSVEQARERGQCLSLLFIDIDFFKKVNDTYGHPEGNVVLSELGRVLVASCRGGDSVSRNGGEEFSVLLPDCPPEQAMEIAGRMRENVERKRFLLSSGVEISITVSIGVASFPLHASDPDKLLEDADIALYCAKREGRNRVRLFKPGGAADMDAINP